MSLPQDVEFSPARTTLHWAQSDYDYDEVQYADFSQIQEAKYGDVKYLQVSESEMDDQEIEGEFSPTWSQSCYTCDMSADTHHIRQWRVHPPA